MKKILRGTVAAVMASMMFATTALAVPSVSELREDKEKAKKKIESLEGQMVDAMEKINKTEEELVNVGQQIIKAEEDLEKAEEKELDQYEAMKKRIVAMYESGSISTSVLATIFEADSVAEILQNAENVRIIHEYDRKQLVEYAKTKESIENLKASLEEISASSASM